GANLPARPPPRLERRPQEDRRHPVAHGPDGLGGEDPAPVPRHDVGSSFEGEAPTFQRHHAYRASYTNSPRSRSRRSSDSTSRPPTPTASRPGPSGSVPRSSATSAACTIRARRTSAGSPWRSNSWISTSNEHSRSRWVNSAPGASNDRAP